MKYRRSYEPRIVGGKVVMMPADLQRLHRYVLDTDVIEVISDEMREVVEAGGLSWGVSCLRRSRTAELPTADALMR